MVVLSNVKRLSSPDAYFLSLSECKEQLAIMECDTQWDSLIAGYIAAASRVIEQRLGQTLMATQWGGVFDAVHLEAGFYTHLPQQPAVSNTTKHPATVLVDGVDVGADVSISTFTNSATIEGGITASGEAVLTWYAGALEPWEVDDNLRVAGKMLVAHFFDHRAAVQDTSAIEIPLGVDSLLAVSSHSGRY